MNTSLKTIIETHNLFRELRPEHKEILACGATQATFKPGQILFCEGNPANQFYLLQSGRVALETHEPGKTNLLVQTLGPGDVFGWSWLFAPFVWHLQGRALEPVEAIALSGAHLLASAERDHEFGYELIKRVAQVVIQRLQATRKQLVEHEVR